MDDPAAIEMLGHCEDCAEGRISEDELSDLSDSHLPAHRVGVSYGTAVANDLFAWVADRYKVYSRGVYPAADAFAHFAAVEAGIISLTPTYEEIEAVRRHTVFASVRNRTEEEWGGLVRDIYGPNPFRPATFDPSWRTEAVVAVARGMYESRDFAAMPVLADALDDAGCNHPDVLAHCRGAGPHVRGCWVVDLVLGKV